MKPKPRLTEAKEMTIDNWSKTEEKHSVKMRTERPLVENWNMLIGWWEEHFWNMLPTFLLLLSIPCSLQVTKNPAVKMLDQFSKFPPKEKMLDEMSFPGADPSPAATPDSQEWAEHQCHSCPGYNAKDNDKDICKDKHKHKDKLLILCNKKKHSYCWVSADTNPKYFTGRDLHIGLSH